MKKLYKILLTLGVFAALAIISFAVVISYNNSARKNTPLVFANDDMLQELWSTFKKYDIETSSGRTLDRSANDITTSEGESYTMLRAAWADDQPTFDRSWQWTKDNLQRDDHLMSWKFGKLPNGTYSVLQADGGSNTATDGDTDIALSLLMAYGRWHQYAYVYDSKAVIDSIWAKEVVMIKGKPVLVADDLERNDKTQVIVNPSYLSPYAYKIFAQVDRAHDWNAVADNAYNVLNQVSRNQLDKASSAGLPPDWIAINRTTGAISAAPSPTQTTNFSYDAMRTPWRLALDYNWFKDPRDKQVLAQYSLLETTWQKNQKLVSTYAHNGTPVTNYESPAIYGGTMGYFQVEQPDTAKQIYNDKLLPLYNPDTQEWANKLSYYDDSWAYFGIALHQNELPNLTIVK